jgi:hypothetical protein
MKYELWDVISYGHGEPLFPFTLIDKSESFSEIYEKFLRVIKKQPCVILLKNNIEKEGRE